MKWIRKREGEIILSGTPFCIRYKDHRFVTYRDDQRIASDGTLDFAKYQAEGMARELAEMGLVELESET